MTTMRKLRGTSLLATALLPVTALAGDVVNVVEIRVERPTVHTAGVQVLITDDDNRDATIDLRVRRDGQTEWQDAPPAFRVHPETVGIAVPEQFAGSVFDLQPGSSYEIELHVVDPDGVDDTQVVTTTTRPIPSDPSSPNQVAVASAAELSSALSAAAPGDIITLAAGTYPGSFSISASGTADDPIVVRGEQADGVVLDGGDCSDCNVLEVYGDYVHIEDLTITNAIRALRFQGDGATGNVVRRVIISDVVHGIGSRPNQTDFYICDNDIRGRLAWPWVFDGDASSHWDDRGIDINGEGHVICHNRIEGFGDPILNMTDGYRVMDVYGNDVIDCFDGIEVDRGTGNVRVFRNRWTNVDSAISIQPANGGPVYILRNELMNVVSEQIKMKQTGGEPSGSLIYHNTFVSPSLALNLQTPITGHNFRVENNLFVGPQSLSGGRTVEWTGGVDEGVFDYNGYFPDGGFWFGVVDGVNRVYDSFAEAAASGDVEANGVLLVAPIFEGGFVGPDDGMVKQTESEMELAGGSNALDVGRSLAGINDGHLDAGPDLGARELGCDAPAFGPRAAEDEDVVAPVDCGEGGDGDDGGTGTDDGGTGTDGGDDGGDGGTGTGDGGTDGGDDGGDDGSDDGSEGGADSDDSGCGCRAQDPSGRVLALLLPLVLASRRRR
ncbi:MAG: right-handed parallel beta-helix repeat-containing protein [Planctomycetota bacterium]|jgi:hypothetical protein